MKTIISTVFCVVLAISAIAQDAKLTINATIVDTLLLNTYQVPIGKQKKFQHYLLPTQEKKTHTFVIPDSLCNKRLYLSYNHNFTFLELYKGQELTINIDEKGMQFGGDNTKVNEYLYDWCNQFIKSSSNAYVYRMSIRNFFKRTKSYTPINLETEQELNKLKGLSNKSMEHLQNYGITDKGFIERQKIWVKYIEERIILENFAYMKGNGIDVNDQCLQAFRSIEFNNIDILQHPDATEMLSKYFDMQESALGISRLIPNVLKSRASEFKQDELKEIYIINELNKLILSQTIFKLDEIVESVTPLIKSNEGKEELARIKQKVNELIKKEMRGKDAFEFEFEDNNGKLVKMSDFKGKYVFIDVWATWCGPCNVNIPYMNMLEEELEDENIAFISISIDKPKDKQKWLNFLDKTHIGGVALMAKNAFKDDMCQYYGVNSIPRFIFIDPQGKIISAHCRQPIDVNFRNYLIDFIKAQ